MNKKLLLLLFLTILACSSKPEKPIPEKQLEGWAGNPDNPNEKPFDYYYMKSTARASEKAIAKRNGEMMKATCIDAATTPIIVKANLVLKMITLSTGYEYREDDSDYDYAEPNARDYLIAFRGKINDFKVRDCKPLGTPNPKYSLIEWKECECTIYLYIKDGKDGVIQIIEKYRYRGI